MPWLLLPEEQLSGEANDAARAVEAADDKSDDFFRSLDPVKPEAHSTLGLHIR